MLLSVDVVCLLGGVCGLIHRRAAPAALASAILMAATLAACPAAAQGLSQVRVEADVGRFFSTYLGRQLSPAETREAAREFVAYFGAKQCEAECAAAIASHRRNVDVFRSKRGGPEDLLLRQVYLTQNTFSDRHVGSTILRLLSEPDPIAVVNRKSSRLMTQADVEALADLMVFARSAGPPTRQTLSAAEAARWVTTLEQGFGTHARRMPVKLTLAAEFRAGLEREWPDLHASERHIVRAYLLNGQANPLPEALVARLLAIPASDAGKIQAAEALDNQLAQFYADLDRHLNALGDAALTWSVLQQIGQATR